MTCEPHGHELANRRQNAQLITRSAPPDGDYLRLAREATFALGASQREPGGRLTPAEGIPLQSSEPDLFELSAHFVQVNPMNTAEVSRALARLFSELVDGSSNPSGAFILNSGDIGLLRSLDEISAEDASRSVNDGATIAAHAQHLRYGLSLMNRWASEGGNPFADATWDKAWTTRPVEAPAWTEIRNRLRGETHRWLESLNSPREVADVELTGMIASIAHLAYHLGAIRQISKTARGPKEGTF